MRRRDIFPSESRCGDHVTRSAGQELGPIEIMSGVPLILRGHCAWLLGSMRDTNLRECPAGKVFGQRSDLAEVQPSV